MFFAVRLLHVFALDEPCTCCFTEKPPCPGELEHKPPATCCKAENTGSLNPSCRKALSTAKQTTGPHNAPACEEHKWASEGWVSGGWGQALFSGAQ